MSKIHELLLITEVERRVIRACKTLRVLPDRSFEHTKSAWPEIWRNTEEAYGYSEVAMPKFRPTPYDVTDCLPALDWVRVLSKREFKIIWWRSFDVSFRQIGIRLHRSDETARRQYKDIMLRVWHEANKPQAAGGGQAGVTSRERTCTRGAASLATKLESRGAAVLRNLRSLPR